MEEDFPKVPEHRGQKFPGLSSLPGTSLRLRQAIALAKEPRCWRRR